MRKILVVGALLLAVLLVVFRQRVFVRDPLGKVERNGVAQDDARVFFNYSNDVLMEEPSAERRYLVQGWSGLPGSPKRLFCLTGLVCWTEADRAEVFPLEKPHQVQALGEPLQRGDLVRQEQPQVSTRRHGTS